MVAKIVHLQGCRGLAIFAVVLFHFIPWHFPNGWLGVDIFFVLSGYLMIKIMSRENSLTWNTVATFWYKRIKRIFPFYYLVILLSTATLFIVSVPNLPQLLISLVNSLFFATNLQPFTGFDYFLKLSAFFDLYTHTWSLCVEVQFYLLFPILYFVHSLLPYGVAKYNPVWTTAGLASLSFYLTANQHLAFNSVFARIWQFMIGTVAFSLGSEKKTSCMTFFFLKLRKFSEQVPADLNVQFGNHLSDHLPELCD